MRVSEHFNLNRAQPDLDFVDVDVVNDLRLYVDPRALRLLQTNWGNWCVFLLQDFFGKVLDAIRAGNMQHARQLLSRLREPNETRLGLSRGRARGRGLGPYLAGEVADSLSQSVAVHTGLLRDLEDTILMIEGISSDLISDITTNVIREPLIFYTRFACETYGIPTRMDVNSGPLWDPERQAWHSKYVPLPVAGGRPLVLVPKAIVRLKMDYDADEYYRHYMLERLVRVEKDANTELVHLLRDGRERVYKKDVAEKYGAGKGAIVRLTREHPEVLEEYRVNKQEYVRPPLDHDTLAEAEGSPPPRWDELLQSVVGLKTGKTAADAYLRAVEKLLTALFYPHLTNPIIEHQIHSGRKRIDVTYANIAESGFFRWLALHYPAPHVFVECKNYREDPHNPALDQLSGRFSPRRGRFGLLVCRKIDNKELFAQRCRDTADDDRGFIVGLDDGDLAALVRARSDPSVSDPFPLIQHWFERLVM